MKYNKYKPYIRKMDFKKDKTPSIVTAYRLAFFQEIKKGGYVLVQHGFPNRVLDVDSSKDNLKKRIAVVCLGVLSFKEWTYSIRNIANKKRRLRCHQPKER